MTADTNQQIPWSHSRLDTFGVCPKRFYHQYVAKDVQEGEPHPVAVWGSEVHKAAELLVKDGTPMPENMKQYEPVVQTLAAIPGVQAEVQFAVNSNWQVVDWFSSEAWGRAIIDVLAFEDGGRTAGVWDYKLGKYRGKTDQARVNAFMIMAAMPQVEQVHTQFLYLAAKKVDTSVFTRDRLAEYMEPTLETLRQIRVCQENDAWHATPSGLCGYCPVTRCQFNKVRR